MPLITDEFRQANFIEAGLWFTIAVIAATFAIRKQSQTRPQCFVLAITLIVFGFSDVVETVTGAWWRPWWLLVWKTVCVIALLTLLIQHYAKRFR